MIFIPCRDGISHHPSERIEPAHAWRGAQVITAFLMQLDEVI